MEDSVPPGVRPVVRVLLLGPEQQLLLLLAQDTVRNHFSWVTLLGDAANVTV